MKHCDSSDQLRAEMESAGSLCLVLSHALNTCKHTKITVPNWRV